jgi:hypothetical protein
MPDLEMPDFSLDHIKRVKPEFWGVIAAVAAVGAATFGNKILGAALLGGAAFVVALQFTPCCDGCAQGQGCGGSVTNPGAIKQPVATNPVVAQMLDPDLGGLFPGPSDGGTDPIKLINSSATARSGGLGGVAARLCS